MSIQPRHAAALLAMLLGCSDSASHPEAPIVLSHLATSAPLPWSASESLAVLGPDTACVLDTYEVRIVCGDRMWNRTTSFGREGRGPREMLVPGTLLPLPDGGLAYVDPRNDRVDLYSPELKWSTSVRMPGMGPVVPPVDNDSILTLMQTSFERDRRTLLLYDLARDTLADLRELRLDAAAVGRDSIAGYPLLRHADEWLVRVTGDAFLWMSPDGQTTMGVLRPPAFTPEFPDSLDLDEARTDLRGIFGRVLESDLERIRQRRKPAYPPGEIAQLDAGGRVWILSNRPAPAGTLIEVFDGTDYIGAVQVPARVLAFRIHDDILVALTRSVEMDSSGLYPRRLEWYRIAES